MMGAASIATAMLVFRVVITLFADSAVVSGSGTSLLPMMTSLVAIAVLIMFAFGLIVVFKERAEQATLELALLDPLTSLGNRRMLENTLKLALRNSVRTKQIGAILLIDLDEFKPLNDSYGHAIGDQLLVEVSYRLKECVKSDDTVVRMGGDEFVVLLNDLGAEPRLARDNALLVAERILAEISRPFQCLTFALDGEQRQIIQHECTCSIGIGFFVSNEVSQEKLLTNADFAMYKAKEQGFTPPLSSTTEQALQNCIDRAALLSCILPCPLPLYWRSRRVLALNMDIQTLFIVNIALGFIFSPLS